MRAAREWRSVDGPGRMDVAWIVANPSSSLRTPPAWRSSPSRRRRRSGRERAPESAVPTGARGPQDASQYQGVLSHGGVEQRERYVLQLQRTAGNAAVSRWLAMVGRRRAEHLAGGSDEPPDDNSPRSER